MDHYDLSLSLLRKGGKISLHVVEHYISLHIPHLLVFHFAVLSNFLLDRNSCPLMYCLYIRKCQTCRNVKDCRAPWERLRVGKKLPDDVTWASTNRAAAIVGRENKRHTDPWVGDTKVALQNSVDPTQSRSGTVQLQFLSGLSKHFWSSTGHLRGRCQDFQDTAPVSCLVWGLMLTEQGLEVNSPYH